MVHFQQDRRGGDRDELSAQGPFEQQGAAGIGAREVVDETVGVQEDRLTGGEFREPHGNLAVEDAELGGFSHQARQPLGDAQDPERV